jgi:hypothetical protein
MSGPKPFERTPLGIARWWSVLLGPPRREVDQGSGCIWPADLQITA